MVNASLNWASIVGIALAVCGAGLYFMRSFKPALARDYDVFFAAIGLLCGGILFFQGWRLDPILQFGQFLLAGTTVFFAYESVRLRGVATDQARRSSYFDDDSPSPNRMPGGGEKRGWEDSYDQFEEPQEFRRRFSGQDNFENDRSEEDFYRPRRTSRAAIPEEAASRRRRVRSESESESWRQNSERQRRMARFGQSQDQNENSPQFGERRTLREDQRRGSRPSVNRQSTRRNNPIGRDSRDSIPARRFGSSSGTVGNPKGTPMRPIEPEDASFAPSRSRTGAGSRPPMGMDQGKSDLRVRKESQPSNDSPTPRKDSSRPKSSRPRDNSSRFDD